MEALYHQTNQCIQEITELFQRLEKDPGNFESIENAIQSKINFINANCEKLNISIFKAPIHQRCMAKMRLDQLQYDNKHIQVFISTYLDICMKALMKVEEAKDVCQDRSMWKEVVSAYLNGKRRDFMYASLINVQNRRRRREQELADREQLLSRRVGFNHTSINVDYLAEEQQSLQNSHRHVDEMLHTGSSMLQVLQGNRETLRGAHRRIIDLANTLGLSNATISLIERRVSQDKYVLFCGMFVTLAVITLVIIYLT